MDESCETCAQASPVYTQEKTPKVYAYRCALQAPWKLRTRCNIDRWAERVSRERPALRSDLRMA